VDLDILVVSVFFSALFAIGDGTLVGAFPPFFRGSLTLNTVYHHRFPFFRWPSCVLNLFAGAYSLVNPMPNGKAWRDWSPNLSDNGGLSVLASCFSSDSFFVLLLSCSKGLQPALTLSSLFIRCSAFVFFKFFKDAAGREIVPLPTFL